MGRGDAADSDSQGAIAWIMEGLKSHFLTYRVGVMKRRRSAGGNLLAGSPVTYVESKASGWVKYLAHPFSLFANTS